VRSPADERDRHRMGARALGTRLTRSAASLARWARVARIGEKYAPGWASWSARRCERPNRVERLHLFPPDGEVSHARRPANFDRVQPDSSRMKLVAGG